VGNATLLERDKATAARFVEIAPRSALIHYAGHAYATDASGGFLPMGHASGDRLDAGTIAHLSLHRTSLVVLAGCATMKGSAERVEGMPSLSRAFLAAGARTVVGTTVDIGDRASARLFRLFYEYLLASQPPSFALRNAQCAFLRGPDPRLRHPSAWAPAQVLGSN
jgi:CHAT domain-containing protein